jgi:hypothetical protein
MRNPQGARDQNEIFRAPLTREGETAGSTTTWRLMGMTGRRFGDDPMPAPIKAPIPAPTAPIDTSAFAGPGPHSPQSLVTFHNHHPAIIPAPAPMTAPVMTRFPRDMGGLLAAAAETARLVAVASSRGPVCARAGLDSSAASTNTSNVLTVPSAT